MRWVLAALIAAVLIAVGVLAAPAARARWRAHQKAEPLRELPRLLAQQRRFKAELDEFLTVGPAGPRLGEPAAPWPAMPCPAACRRLDIEACASFGCLDFAPAPTAAYRYACRAARRGDAYDVTCAAAADADGDGVASLVVIGTSTTGHLVVPLPDLGVDAPACARVEAIPAEVPFDCAPAAR